MGRIDVLKGNQLPAARDLLAVFTAKDSCIAPDCGLLFVRDPNVLDGQPILHRGVGKELSQRNWYKVRKLVFNTNNVLGVAVISI